MKFSAQILQSGNFFSKGEKERHAKIQGTGVRGEEMKHQCVRARRHLSGGVSELEIANLKYAVYGAWGTSLSPCSSFGTIAGTSSGPGKVVRTGVAGDTIRVTYRKGELGSLRCL